MIPKVKQGDPFRLKAKDWNEVAEVVNGLKQAPRGDTVTVGMRLDIRNTTGGELPRFAFVSPYGVVVSPTEGLDDFCENPVFGTVIPAADDTDCVLLCTEVPISDNDYGTAVATGVCIVQFSTANALHGFAVPDGSGGLKTAAQGAVPVLYCEGTGSEQWGAVLLGWGGGSGAGAGDYYRGYFKLSIVEKTRQVENPDYDAEDEESEQYITESYKEAHHSGGRYTINGQVGSMQGGDVTGDLDNTLQDVILHYHVNGGIEDQQPTGINVELAALQSNTLTDSYWLIGQASVDEVIQQSHGVPSLLWFGCREEEQSVSEVEQ